LKYDNTSTTHFSLLHNANPKGWHQQGAYVGATPYTKRNPPAGASPQDAFSMTGVKSCNNSDNLLV
jgi:hypothetical protein